MYSLKISFLKLNLVTSSRFQNIHIIWVRITFAYILTRIYFEFKYVIYNFPHILFWNVSEWRNVQLVAFYVCFSNVFCSFRLDSNLSKSRLWRTSQQAFFSRFLRFYTVYEDFISLKDCFLKRQFNKAKKIGLGRKIIHLVNDCILIWEGMKVTQIILFEWA